MNLINICYYTGICILVPQVVYVGYYLCVLNNARIELNNHYVNMMEQFNITDEEGLFSEDDSSSDESSTDDEEGLYNDDMSIEDMSIEDMSIDGLQVDDLYTSDNEEGELCIDYFLEIEEPESDCEFFVVSEADDNSLDFILPIYSKAHKD